MLHSWLCWKSRKENPLHIHKNPSGKTEGFLSVGKLLSADETLFLEGAKSLGADLELDLFAVNDNSLGLQVRLPNFLGVALRKANVVTVLLAFAGDVTLLHE
jgi:hypothetical protein